MCRIIAAVGRIETGRFLRALRVMAENENPAYGHELRAQGKGLTHDCGWGVLHRDGAKLTRTRSALPCFADGAFESVADIETDLLVLHARRTKDRDTVEEKNSHPFLATYRGEVWGFCHNGEVRDLSQLTHTPDLVPEATIDSERLFFHTLSRLDRSDPRGSLERTLGEIHDFTCLNSVLVGPDTVLAYARKDPRGTLPRYYTLWHGRARGLDLVSSEIVDGLGVEWEPVPDGAAVALEPS
jgi:predicted glutamine amidotransferase